jgi:hypothetical protein
MIVIMQRIHEDDMSGFLLKGGSGDVWHHLVIPGRITEEVLAKKYPEDYTHGVLMDLSTILEEMHFGDL